MTIAGAAVPTLTKTVIWELAPAASETPLFNVQVLDGHVQPAPDIEINVNPPGSVSVTVADVAGALPVFVTVMA